MKLKPPATVFIRKLYCTQIFKIMRNTAIILLLNVFHICAFDAYSQETALTVNLENYTVRDILAQIEEQSEFYFLYNSKLIDANRKTSLKVEDHNIDQVLTMLFKDTGVNYLVYNRQIVLSPGEFSDALSTHNLDPEITLTNPQQMVTGRVTDSQTGETLPGVSVIIKGTNTGVITNADGIFSLSNVPDDAVLIFSYVGMQTQELPVEGRNEINVELNTDVIGIEEVVAVGYGTMRKVDLTGSVVRADIETFSESPNTNILESLKGNVPGLDVGQIVESGEEPTMLIRGQSTLAGSNNPLVVVDGVIFRGSLNDINPNDIESIDILKDASAAAVYGSQATNGVILLTTTKEGGIAGKPVFSYSGTYSQSSPIKELHPPDIEGFHKQTERSIILQSRTEESGYLELNPDWELSNVFSVFEEVEAYRDGRYHDWYSALVNDQIYNQEHYLSMTNRTEYNNYLISIGYNDQAGYMKNEGYNRFSGRINIDNNMADWLQVGVQSFISASDYSGAQPSLTHRYIEPYATPTNADGERYNTILAGLVNPSIEMERNELNQHLNLFGNIYADINLPFIEGLSHRVNFANNYRSIRHYRYRTYAVDFQGQGDKEVSFRYDWTIDNILSFERRFNDVHNIQMTLLYGLEKSQYDYTLAVAQIFINDVLGYNRLQVGSSEMQQANSGAWDESSLYSMARVFYGYDNKYMLTGTIRRDGFSGFGSENKFGVFPSLSLAWNASEESFFRDNITWLDFLKLRASYGTVGNRTIGRYQTLARVSGRFGYMDMSHTPLYTQNISSLESPNLKWEKTTGINLGVDFGFLSQRLMGTVDYYNNNTTDLFYNVDIPAISRYTNFPDNLGKLQNHGIEISLNSINIRTTDTEWSTSFNYSRNRNELKELLGFDTTGDGKEDDLVAEGLFIGESIDAIYDYQIDGKWQIGDDIPPAWDIGAHKPVDQNDDGIIHPLEDKVIVGYTSPAYSFGISNSIRHKNWSLKFFIHSIQGGKNHYLGPDNYLHFAFQNDEMHFRYIFPEDLDFWSPENPDARYQRPNIYTASGTRGTLYGDRSFIRLQNVTLSYNLSEELLGNIGLHSARIYLNGKNLITITDWNGWDPETNQTITRNGRPVLKSYTIGLNIDF